MNKHYVYTMCIQWLCQANNHAYVGNEYSAPIPIIHLTYVTF
jgi:hypothetical protein